MKKAKYIRLLYLINSQFSGPIKTWRPIHFIPNIKVKNVEPWSQELAERMIITKKCKQYNIDGYFLLHPKNDGIASLVCEIRWW
jgi:hypothetical protein